METLAPAYKKNPQAIVFSTDDGYAPYLAVTLQSLLANANSKSSYDLVVLDSGISEHHKAMLQQICAGNPLVSLRFFDIIAYTDQFKHYLYSSAYFSIAMYFRLFIPKLFADYEKVLYLDCDLVVTCDVNQLLETPMDKFGLAAAADMTLDNDNSKNFARARDYITNDLGIANYQDYFNSGVLVFNLAHLAKIDLGGDCMKMLKDHPNLRFPDQDLLNMYFQGKIKKLDTCWNFQWAKVLDNNAILPAEMPKVIHYTTAIKPWNKPDAPLANQFWHYARQTDVYETIIYTQFQNGLQTTLNLIFNRRNLQLNYWRYKVLANLTVGTLHLKYERLKKQFKDSINQYKKLRK